MEEKLQSRLVQMPHSIGAEKATLGAALFSSDARDQILDILNEDDFYEETHRVLFGAIKGFKESHPRGVAVDRVTFETYLRSINALEKCGGIAYVEALSESAPITLNALQYAKIVKDYSLRRKSILFCENLSRSSFNEAEEIVPTLDKGVSELTDLSTYGARSSEFYKASDLIMDLHAEIERLGKLQISSGIKTGFDCVDSRTGGFKKSQYIVIAARPSCGKTAFALSCMSYMLDNSLDYIDRSEEGEPIKKKRPVNVAFFSLEMPKEDILKRMLSMRSLVPFSSISDNKISDPESVIAKRLYAAVERFYDVSKNFYIYDSDSMNIGDLKAAARKIKRNKNIDIIFIDYLSRINTSGMGAKMQSWEKWSEVSRQLKSLAHELQIPVVCLAQLNREAESSKSQPTLANLRDTGAIEQDADVVILLHDPNRNKEEAEGVDDQEAIKYSFREGDTRVDVLKRKPINLIIAKQRNGETGSDNVVLMGDFVRFVNENEVSIK